MRKPTIFDYQAQVGITKHLGGLDSTKTLIDRCNIEGGERILEIGCGVGASAVYLAKEFGCHVTGIDISERMIARARERAQANKVEHLTTFRKADMNELPFPPNTFDIVFCESVLAFSKQKPKAVAEMARVTVPGGFVALNESAWLYPPTDELVEWFSQDMAAEASIHQIDGWVQLVKDAGLRVISEQEDKIVIKDEVRGIVQRFGITGLLKSMLRGIAMYFKRPDYREFLAETRKTGVAPGNPEEYLGYAIIIAEKI